MCFVQGDVKMKVLYITNIPSPYRVDFFNELGKYCELTVLFERNDAKNREKDWLKIENQNYKSIYMKGFKIGEDSSLCLDVIKYLTLKKYDIIVVGIYSTPTGMLAINYMKIKGIPFCLNTDGGFIKEEGKLKEKLKKYFIGAANAWLSTGDMANKYLFHYDAKKSSVYKYPFTSVKNEDIIQTQLNDKQKKTIKNKLDIKYNTVVIAVGQLIHRKGFDILLKSSKTLNKGIGVYIIGQDASQEYLDIMEKHNINNVHFIGFKKKEDLKQYYLCADLFVLPTREDIWGLVINEAMSCGLPIITTDKCLAGLELVKNNENGYIIPSENEVILSQKINELTSNKVKLREMSNNNLKKINYYSIENMAYSHMEIFNTILNGK